MTTPTPIDEFPWWALVCVIITVIISLCFAFVQAKAWWQIAFGGACP